MKVREVLEGSRVVGSIHEYLLYLDVSMSSPIVTKLYRGYYWNLTCVRCWIGNHFAIFKRHLKESHV